MGQRRTTIIRILKTLGIGVLALVLLMLIIPMPQPKGGYSTALYASDQSLLGARIADDGQWRFPISEDIPSHFKTCLLLFEDEYFYSHPGINPVSIFRALRQNWEAGKIVSGGSTITMQLARILHGNSARTIGQKLIEIFTTLQLELRYSKAEILNLYAGLAPFGGNVVGLEAASWRYYGRSPDLLSLSESATLAVLPNAPSLIYPGKGQDRLLRKRNRLLKKLYDNGLIDQTDYDLSLGEPLPQKPFDLPQKAPHLLDNAIKNGQKGQKIRSSIDYSLQVRHTEIASRFHRRNHDNEIHNLAIMVAEIESGKILSYVGNSDCNDADEGNDVDIIQAARSSGSILKPLLYAAAYDEGLIAPPSLLPDVPTRIAGYAPKNFDGSYSGAISSATALTRSLNVPAVKLLQEYGLDKFHQLLNDLSFSTIKKPANHYGLSLILGGAEVSLYDLVNVYRQCGLQLNEHHKERQPKATEICYYNETSFQQTSNTKYPIGPGALWQMMDVLSNVKRPREEEGWDQYSRVRKVAWKTGTSFGHRDAWAIGIDGQYVVGIWVGNADGEGRPGLTGLNYAGPILFDVFKTLGVKEWFSMPYDELIDVQLCKDSGYRRSANCTNVISVEASIHAERLKTCNHHVVLNIDSSANYQVNLDCVTPSNLVRKSYFQLPPTQAYFYKKSNAHYPALPPWRADCTGKQQASIDIIYPFKTSDLSVARSLDGTINNIVMSAAHSNSRSRLHWHLDDRYIGTTAGTHSLSILPEPGKHVLYIIDDNGVEASRRFRVVE